MRVRVLPRAQQFQFPALRRLETTQLGPSMTGLVETEGSLGDFTIDGGREFPPEGAEVRDALHPDQRRDEGNGTNIPFLYRIPLGIVAINMDFE